MHSRDQCLCFCLPPLTMSLSSSHRTSIAHCNNSSHSSSTDHLATARNRNSSAGESRQLMQFSEASAHQQHQQHQQQKQQPYRLHSSSINRVRADVTQSTASLSCGQFVFQQQAVRPAKKGVQRAAVVKCSGAPSLTPTETETDLLPQSVKESCLQSLQPSAMASHFCPFSLLSFSHSLHVCFSVGNGHMFPQQQ